MFGTTKLKEKNRKLEYELEDAKSFIKELKKEIRNFDKKLEQKDLDLAEKLEKRDYADRKVQRQRDEEIEGLEKDIDDLTNEKQETVEKLEATIETLQQQVEAAQELKKRSIELDNRETVIEAQEVNAKNFKTKLVEAKAEGEKVAEDRFRAGYADGLADGLRKAHEITAEDRRAGMQIAALAAASHQPDATKQIAAAIAKDVARALPSGSTSRKK